jgi:thiol-disulfide isomerase/thioredoxin
MKVRIIILSLALTCGLFLQITAQKIQGFTLNCQFKKLPDGTKAYLLTQEKDTVAKTISKGERFIFNGKLNLEGRFHFIVFDTLVSKVPSKAIFLTNRTINVLGVFDQKNISVTGSPEHSQYETRVAQETEMSRKKQALYKQLSTLEEIQSKDTSSANKVALEKVGLLRDVTNIDNITMENGKKWIIDHPESLYTPYIIIAYKRVLRKEGVEKAFERLSPKAKQSYYGQKLIVVIENLKIAGAVKKGTMMPNFKVISPNGDAIYLQEEAKKSKYTLFDFWASWCSPCRAEVPKLKNLYAKYKDKGLSIIGISSDKKVVDWKKALKEDGTPWLHAIQVEDNPISEHFDFKAIPAYILVDHEGKMIAFDCAMSNIPSFGGSLRGEALDRKLQELLGSSK